MFRLMLWLLVTVGVLVFVARYPTSTAGPLRPVARPAVKTVVGDKVRVTGGMVQVRIAVAGTRMTKVDVPVYPAGDRRTRQHSQHALHKLVRETLAAQSAKIDPVGGAAALSAGYRESLRSALHDAGL